MVFIDWISTKEHRSFNESFLAALQVKDALLFTFAEVMRVTGQRNIVQLCTGGRIARALKVWKICWAMRGRPIFLLSYDAMMFPVLQLFCRRLFVYEHNTTPEGRLYRKHAAWQRLMFRRVTRFAQFHAQHETLREIGQNSYFLGSPLPERVEIVRTNPSLFIAPSDRIEMETLLKLKPLVGSDEVIIRNYKFSADELAQIRAQINVRAVGYIDMDHDLPLTKGIVIAIASKIRGSGWFNEGIRFGVPLIIIEKEVQQIFEATFPAYPYVALDMISSPADLDNALGMVSSFDGRSYIVAHNEQLRNTFERVVGQAKPE
jgi:hypothetical protein